MITFKSKFLLCVKMSIYWSKVALLFSILPLVISCQSEVKMDTDRVHNLAHSSSFSVFAVGSMKDSVKNPYGRFNLYDFRMEKNLYALGTGENLIGEIYIRNGQVSYFTINKKSQIEATKRLPKKAPFFIFAYVHKWKKISIPRDVITLKQLEEFIDIKTKSDTENGKDIIPFSIEAKIKSCNIHIARVKESSYFKILNEEATMVGFYSKKYAGRYTYNKESHSHIHVVFNNPVNKSIIGGGHVDDVLLQEDGEKYLYLPG